jgi:hypothetical protein
MGIPKREEWPEMYDSDIPQSIRDHMPIIFEDANAYCCMLGDDFAIGITGCGKTPKEAMLDWDKAYRWLIQKDPELKSIWYNTRNPHEHGTWVGCCDDKSSETSPNT